MGIYILCTRVKRHTQVYVGMHTYANVYTGIQKHTVFTVLYTSKYRYTQVKTGIHTCAHVYQGTHKYTKV